MRATLLLLPLACLPLSGCFWGDADASAFFRVSSGNYDQYQDLLFPAERAAEWKTIFEARPTVCADGSDECDEREPSGKVEVFIPYETSRARGLITQKGDLQITSHLRIGESYKTLAADDFDGWAYMLDADRIEGAEGDGCGVAPEGEEDTYTRTGVGRCLLSEVRDNIAAYRALSEDLRLVVVLNILGVDDVRSVDCQDALDRPEWDYPRTMRVNYNAEGPIALGGDDDEMVYAIEDEEQAPLSQCDIDVFTQLQLGSERFSGDWYGQDARDRSDFTLDRANGDDETLLGTVELDDLVLPGDGSTTARGRYNLRFTSERFAARDGKVTLEGTFDVEVRKDAQAVEEPEREVDLGNPSNPET